VGSQRPDGGLSAAAAPHRRCSIGTSVIDDDDFEFFDGDGQGIEEPGNRRLEIASSF